MSSQQQWQQQLSVQMLCLLLRSLTVVTAVTSVRLLREVTEQDAGAQTRRSTAYEPVQCSSDGAL
jgi:hypothetical protein